MVHLYQKIQEKVLAWRNAGYPAPEYPAIAEILNYATLQDSNILRFLRGAQIRALETYWYLRLVEGTPHIFDLYQSYYKTTTNLLEALGLGSDEFIRIALDEGPDQLFERIKTDKNFVKQHKLESVHKSLTLSYLS